MAHDSLIENIEAMRFAINRIQVLEGHMSRIRTEWPALKPFLLFEGQQPGVMAIDHELEDV